MWGAVACRAALRRAFGKPKTVLMVVGRWWWWDCGALLGWAGRCGTTGRRGTQWHQAIAGPWGFGGAGGAGGDLGEPFAAEGLAGVRGRQGSAPAVLDMRWVAWQGVGRAASRGNRRMRQQIWNSQRAFALASWAACGLLVGRWVPQAWRGPAVFGRPSGKPWMSWRRCRCGRKP